MSGRDLSGLTALVTGASSGIGLATVQRLAAAGATVFGAAREGRADLIIDVAAPGASETIVAAALDRLGGIDIVVPNAGISGFVPLDGHPDALWDAMIGINLGCAGRRCRRSRPVGRAASSPSVR